MKEDTLETTLETTFEVAAETKYYVDVNGTYLGGWDGTPPEGAIEVSPPPTHADQPWLFPGWGPSPSVLKEVEDVWREAELIVIANQLDALEEAEAGEVPEDLLPGTRTQWLSYRGKVRNWVDGKGDFPDITKRPVRPE